MNQKTLNAIGRTILPPPYNAGELYVPRYPALPTGEDIPKPPPADRSTFRPKAK